METISFSYGAYFKVSFGCNKELVTRWFQFSYPIILAKSDTVHNCIPPLLHHFTWMPLNCASNLFTVNFIDSAENDNGDANIGITELFAHFGLRLKTSHQKVLQIIAPNQPK